MNKIAIDSIDLIKNNIEKLKELFPNIVTDGKIDFDVLKTMLGEDIETSNEKYQFNWNGKKESIKTAYAQSTTTLRPCKEKSKEWDSTENLYIEGDNLEVLKQLQKTYFGKIKFIYIDPPYNTGNDFVYKDNFTNSIDAYTTQTKQFNQSNPNTSGRFHSDWCSMIYPRLLLARNLLTDDGVIFISIDDHEQENLKKICNEVFGENNFISQIVWERAFSPINLMKHFSPSHDYILCYCRNPDITICNGIQRSNETNSRYANPDNDPRGVWSSSDISVGPAIQSNIYPIVTPSGRVVEPPAGRSWRLSEKAFSERLQDNRIWFGEDGNGVPRIKRFLSELKKQGITPMTLWKCNDVGHSQDATKSLAKIFDNKKYFDYPKPVDLIKRCLQLYTDKESIVMDFFSGSATTAHAVMQLNADDNGNRKFIMIQLPEQCEGSSEACKDGYKTICDIGEERIRRAGDNIKQEWIEKHLSPKNDIFSTTESQQDFPVDIGFKVFTLDSSNIIPWDNTNQYDEKSLAIQSDTFLHSRSKEDILYEILLKYGLFDQQVNEITVNNKKMFSVGRQYMIVCLDEHITDRDIKEIGLLKPRVVVFGESGFYDDNVKINAEYNLIQDGVEDVKCI